jgi:hypothetical protein
MARYDKYIGLNEKGASLVADPSTTKEVIGKIKGAWVNVVNDLHRFTLPNGRIYNEFVQCEVWMGGPCYFIALKDNRGRTLRRTLWTPHGITNADHPEFDPKCVDRT